jgi:hypothetical protein
VSILVERQRHACEQQRELLDQQLAALGSKQRSERLVLEFRHGQLGANIAWLDRCLDTLLPSSRSIDCG